MKRTRNKTMRELLKQSEKCELCGSRRLLEVHHIIPVIVGGPEDNKDNMIVVCVKCHALLTLRGLLTKIGIERARNNNTIGQFAEKFLQSISEQKPVSASETIEIFQDSLKENFEKYSLH